MLNLMRTIKNWCLARIHIAVVLATIGLWPIVSFAQNPPKAPQLQKVPPVWLGYLVMALLLAVVLAVSLMPSKRSHQD